ncbi:MAG TPA: variant-type mycofactocin precursor, partial [Syntrophales bacterium]|nr:variant-type mycofactocin precursor [Syntrophales bacterium]
SFKGDVYPPDVKIGCKSPEKDAISRKGELKMETKNIECQEEPRILDEIQVEELAIDGICGVY